MSPVEGERIDGGSAEGRTSPCSQLRKLNVLVVDDHPEQIRALVRWCAVEAPGWTLQGVHDAAGALSAILNGCHDVVILDWQLGDGPSGLDLCRDARAQGCGTPIIMLTVEEAVSNRIRALEAGADEFMVKGAMSMRELIARIDVVVLRWRDWQSTIPPGPGPIATVGPITVNLGNHGVVVRGVVLELPKHQRRLLVHLARSVSETVSHEELCRAGDFLPGPKYKNLHNEILRLRRLLGSEAARHVQTVRGNGYCLR